MPDVYVYSSSPTRPAAASPRSAEDTAAPAAAAAAAAPPPPPPPPPQRMIPTDLQRSASSRHPAGRRQGDVDEGCSRRLQ